MNSKIPAPIRSLSDKQGITVLVLFSLLKGINKDSFDPAYVLESQEEDAVKENCQYFLSSARKMGATLFMVWEDIIKVNTSV